MSILNLVLNVAALTNEVEIKGDPKNIFKLELEREKLSRFLKKENEKKETSDKNKLNATN